MKDFTKGFFLSLIACVLSLVGLVVYAFVMYKLPIVFVLLIVAILLTVVAFMLNKNGGDSPIIGLLPWCNALLNAGALVSAIYLMVNQIGYVIAQLDTIDTILTFIIFEVIALVAVILNIVASFLPMRKEA